MENVPKCVQCGSEVAQTPGKKPKIYCTANCRIKHWQKTKRKSPKEPPNSIVHASSEHHSRVLGELEVLKSANIGLSKDNEGLREQLASLQSKYDKLVEFNKTSTSAEKGSLFGSQKASTAYGPRGEELQPGQTVVMPESWTKNDHAPFKTYNEILALAKRGASSEEIELAINSCRKLTSGQLDQIRAQIKQQ